MLGLTQTFLGKEMLLSISCLTDQDSKHQRNVSLWQLTKAIYAAKDKEFERKVNSALSVISGTVAKIRRHRHKGIAHLDLDVAVGLNSLPEVLLSEIRLALEQMEAYLNLYQWEFQKNEVSYKDLPCDEFTAVAYWTACKAKAFDELEAEGVIPIGGLERRMEIWKIEN